MLYKLHHFIHHQEVYYAFLTELASEAGRPWRLAPGPWQVSERILGPLWAQRFKEGSTLDSGRTVNLSELPQANSPTPTLLFTSPGKGQVVCDIRKPGSHVRAMLCPCPTPMTLTPEGTQGSRSS